MLKRVIWILVNWHSSTRVFWREDSPLVKIPVELYQFTRIQMTRFNVSCFCWRFFPSVAIPRCHMPSVRCPGIGVGIGYTCPVGNSRVEKYVPYILHTEYMYKNICIHHKRIKYYIIKKKTYHMIKVCIHHTFSIHTIHVT